MCGGTKAVPTVSSEMVTLLAGCLRLGSTVHATEVAHNVPAGTPTDLPARRHIRRSSDVGITPIMPTSSLCRSVAACVVRRSVQSGRHNRSGRLSVSSAASRDREDTLAKGPEVAALPLASSFTCYNSEFGTTPPAISRRRSRGMSSDSSTRSSPRGGRPHVVVPTPAFAEAARDCGSRPRIGITTRSA
jgi:hypothetical protein